MLDIITATSNKRGELLSYVKGKVSEESYVWARNLLSDVSKKILTVKDDEFTIRAYPLYKNVKKFFTEVCSDVTPGCILLTLYLCSLELGIRKFGDPVESLKDFTEEVDSDDWSKMTLKEVIDYDLVAATLLTQKYLGMDVSDDLRACGLHTLNLMDFVCKKV